MTRTTVVAALLTLTMIHAIPSSLTRAENPQVKITDSKLHPINYAADSLKHWIDKAAQGDARRASALLHDLEKLETRFGRIPTSDSEQYRHVASRLKQLRTEIAQKSNTSDDGGSAKKAANTKPSATRPNPAISGIESLVASLEQDLNRYKDNHKQRSRMRGDVSTLKQRLSRVPANDHPSYKALQQRIGKLETSLQDQGGPLNMSDKEVADYVERIRVKYSEEIRLPEVRDIMTNRELMAKDVDGIMVKMKLFAENVDADLPKLRRVVESTGQGEYWLNWLEKRSIEQLKKNITSIKTTIDNHIKSELRDARQRSELDTEKNKYAFTNESMLKQQQADHARSRRTLQQAARLEKLLGLPATWSPKLQELEGYIATWQKKVGRASVVRELPVEVGTKELHTIANEALRQEKYGVGKVVHMIVANKPVPRDRIEHKAFNGKIETIVRVWEQFQVTTIEAENGKLSVYVNDLSRFSRAPRTTPIGKWILTTRFKRGEISWEDLNASK